MSMMSKILSNLIAVLLLVTAMIPLTVFSQDTSCGIVWYPPVILSPTNESAYTPRMAVQGDTIHLTYTGGGYRLAYARSVNAGIDFEPVRDLITDSIRFPFHNIGPILPAANTKNLYIFFIGGTNGLAISPIFKMISSDRGQSWTEPEAVTDTDAVPRNVSIIGDTISILVNIDGLPADRTLTTIDGGNTWIIGMGTIIAGSPQIAVTKHWLHLVYNIYIENHAFEVIYKRSSDFGMTWQDSTVISTLDYYGSSSPSIATTPEGDVYVAWTDTKYGCEFYGCTILFRHSTDEGSTWQDEQVLSDFVRRSYSGLSALGTQIGASWHGSPDGINLHIETRVSFTKAFDWCPVIDHTTYLKSYARAVYPSIAVGKSSVVVAWEQVDTLSSDDFYIVARTGVFLPTSVDEDFSRVPNEYELFPAYPNPFNPKTKIRFMLHASSFTSLKVYDIFGREVATLVNEKKEAGEHEVEWDAKNMPSGIYFYRILSGNFSATGKVLLLK